MNEMILSNICDLRPTDEGFECQVTVSYIDDQGPVAFQEVWLKIATTRQRLVTNDVGVGTTTIQFVPTGQYVEIVEIRTVSHTSIVKLILSKDVNEDIFELQREIGEAVQETDAVREVLQKLSNCITNIYHPNLSEETQRSIDNVAYMLDDILAEKERTREHDQELMSAIGNVLDYFDLIDGVNNDSIRTLRNAYLKLSGKQ